MSETTLAPRTHTNEHTERATTENARPGVVLDEQKAWALGWMSDFLAALERSPYIEGACKAAGVSKANVYEARKVHPDFAEAWANTRDGWVDRLETKAISKALDGDTIMLIFLLKNLRPESYSERLELRHTGSVEHRHGVIDGKEPRELDAARRHEAVRLRLLEAGAQELVEGSEAA